MKYTVILAAVVAVTTAHSIADLPSCSLDCLSNAVKGLGCDLTDFACSCKKAEQLTSAITSSLKKDCTKEADQEKVASVLEFLCKGVGVDINAPAGNTATPGPSSAAQPVLATSKPGKFVSSHYPFSSLRLGPTDERNSWHTDRTANHTNHTSGTTKRSL
jgi:hypothetical protein